MLQVVRKKLGPDEAEFWLLPGFVGLLVLLCALVAVLAGPMAVQSLTASAARREAAGLRLQVQQLEYENIELRRSLSIAQTRVRALENAAR